MKLFTKQVDLSTPQHLYSLFIALFLLVAIPLTVATTLQVRDQRSKAATIPNDPLFSVQWGLDRINAPEAWDITKGSTAIKVAVVDTGINTVGDPFVAELAPQVGVGYNAITPGGTTQDDYGSYGAGVRAASVIGSKTNNSTAPDNGALAGVAWDITMLPVKVCGATGACTADDLAEGINWSVSAGAKIIAINVSLSSTTAAIDSAIQNAVNNGVLLVAMSGNVASGTFYPAANPNVISVGAINSNDTVASFSNQGPSLDFVAPGSSIPTLVRGGCCLSGSGTNLAAAHVVGTLTLLLSLPGVTTTQVQQCLKDTVVDLGVSGRDNVFGHGLINAFAAVQACGLDTLAPVTSTTSPSNGSTISGTVTISASATDNVGVTKVEFYQGTVKLGEDASAPYSISWNTTSVTNGSYSLTSRAYDAANNVGFSPGVSVTVNNTPDTVPPSVPSQVKAMSFTSSVKVSWGASTDNVGVVGYEVYRNGVKISGNGKVTSTSYIHNTNNFTGSYTVKAFDAANNASAFSDPPAAAVSCLLLDVTDDNVIDLQDALAILDHFGENPADPKYDMDLNGYVDLQDALLNLQYFGLNCSEPASSQTDKINPKGSKR